MIKNVQIALAAPAVATLFILPTPILAAPQLSYTTVLEPTGPTAFASRYYRGSLTLTVGSDNMVRGWYRPQDGQFLSVSGSLKDNHLWLEIGDNGNLQIFATEKPDGTFEGNATDVRTPGLIPLTFSFAAAPTNS